MSELHRRAPGRRPIPRLSQRYGAPDVALRLAPATRRRWCRAEPAEVRVVDLSIDGALVEADDSRNFAIGSEVVLELDGVPGRGRVRHLQRASDRARMGIAFTCHDEPFRAALHRVIGASIVDPRRHESWRVGR